ncbi:dihydrofolate reductase [Hymenobacter saemangeumensis]|uniref:Dihydrofolate reductase n=1 Tax=Hymenobacter saemangeumensis TaxID=1084522 RepID=A0ABP8IAL7_9BACT
MKRILLPAALLLGITAGCTRTTPSNSESPNSNPIPSPTANAPADSDAATARANAIATGRSVATPPPAQVVSEQFADLRILRYAVPGFETLSTKQKELLYYLSEAALSGRDIIYDQNYKHNLRVRRTLEAVWEANQERLATPSQAEQARNFSTYAKRVWFSNGIHHHYSTRKFVPDCTPAYFAGLVRAVDAKTLPLLQGESVDQFLKFITPIIFDPNVAPKRVNQEKGKDLVVTSANNFYEGVSQLEVENFYAKLIDKNDPRPISYGLNSKLERSSPSKPIQERVWHTKGMYGKAINQIAYWLGKAEDVAETVEQKEALGKLILFYSQGDLKKWDDYNIAWVKDTRSRVDVVNGFIEVYGDPLGMRASYESVVSFKDLEASKRIAAIAKEAQWFENSSPIMDAHKKKNVVGITAKVITVVTEAGDAAPSTPIGINLPNAEWIRKEHGSKSVSLGNIVEAYDQASANSGLLDEFAYSKEEVARARQHMALAGKLHTDMHEVIGHASGQLNAGVGTPKQTLKSYASALEEGRADLVALYYLPDAKLQQLGVVPSADVAKAAYDNYMRNGLMTQLTRLQPGETVEEAHMRNRQMVARWVLEKGQKEKVVEMVKRDGKTYVRINNYDKLRQLFGQLLRETQRITSEGDYRGAQNLIETYGVKVDPVLHKEVLARYAKLNIAPYQGFIQPKLVPVELNGRLVDVKVEYPDDFARQMLDFGHKYKTLPDYN